MKPNVSLRMDWHKDGRDINAECS